MTGQRPSRGDEWAMAETVVEGVEPVVQVQHVDQLPGLIGAVVVVDVIISGIVVICRVVICRVIIISDKRNFFFFCTIIP